MITGAGNYAETFKVLRLAIGSDYSDSHLSRRSTDEELIKS